MIDNRVMTDMSATPSSSTEAWGIAVSALMARILDAFCRLPDMGMSPKAADLSVIARRKSRKLAGVAGRIVAKRGIVRPVDHADPRSLDHPSHEEQWLELARAIGRSMAREQYAKDHRAPDETETENRSALRPVLK
jgi:hypothetical protein